MKRTRKLVYKILQVYACFSFLSQFLINKNLYKLINTMFFVFTIYVKIKCISVITEKGEEGIEL